MNTIKSKLLLILLLTSIAGCTDFLVRPPQGELTQSNFPTSGDDALLATNAVYNTLRESGFNFGLFPILDIMSDDARKGSNPDDAAAAINPYDNFTFIATEGNISNWWNALYLGVKRANVVIEKVPAIEMDEAQKARYLGEAKFLRAFFYFDLVRAWGDVPLITSTEPDLTIGRAPKAQIYDLIISDLTDAMANLPEKSEYSGNDIGRATKGAAKSLIARVYLFLGDFTNAGKYAVEVINSGQYSLETNFADANSILGEQGIESVFEAGAFGLEGIENGGNSYGNVQGVRGTPNRGWGFNRPSIDLQNSFETEDPRKDATIIYLGEVLDGVTILGDGLTPDETKDASGNVIEIECYNQKVWTPGNTVPTQFGYNRRFIRYADVLLMAAEALNETGNSPQALIYLEQVRARARGGNSALLPEITELNKDLLRDIIFNERRHELALEGLRFWDLVRTGRAKAVLGPLGFKEGKNELLPIPQAEMDLTGNKWSQNPFWD
jgi:tetratricopeptide (TPR) repeat protein